jgi:hypothetical protein
MDVYLNTRRDLLVVEKGAPIPAPAQPGSWRKSKKVARVSAEIELAIKTRGYYMRKRRNLPAKGRTSSAPISTDVQSLQHHN